MSGISANLSYLADLIGNLLKRLWAYLKKVVTKVFSFMDQIVNYFHNLNNQGVIGNKVPIAYDISTMFANGEFAHKDLGLSNNKNVLVGLFDMENKQLDTINSKIVSAESLDAKSKDILTKNKLAIFS